MPYQPPQKILDKYADLLVNFALNSGKGVKPGEVILVQVPEFAKPMLISLQRVILKAKAHMILQYSPDGLSREFYQLASDKQIAFFPEKYLKARVETVDHSIAIIGEADLRELEGISPHKVMMRQKAWKPYMEWRDKKEDNRKFTWVLALYGNEAMAKEAKMSVKEYWKEIIKACYLDAPSPIAKWKAVYAELHRIRSRLDKLKIQKVRVLGKNVDLTIGIGKNRIWKGGDGRNIPGFEIYTTPDREKVDGHISFNVPLYRMGTVTKGIKLEFKNGTVVKATAKQGEKFLKEMIATPGADHIGEFSMTDNRLSRITKFMAETLFDENVGGKYGNSHIALGHAIRDTYPGNKKTLTEKQWLKMGYNESVIHTDIFTTEDRTVTATLENGKIVVIYRKGRFTI